MRLFRVFIPAILSLTILSPPPHASAAMSVGISVGIAPPELRIYEPACQGYPPSFHPYQGGVHRKPTIGGSTQVPGAHRPSSLASRCDKP
jgi:hypothetical protein